MPPSRRTQKQVAERLKGNLDYYNRPHPWRTRRFWISTIAVLAGLGAVPAYYYFHAPEQFMNPGPISRGHAQIANDCAACHPQTALIKADSHEAGNILRTEYFVPMDQACLGCHKNFNFHEPNVVPDLTRPAGTGAQMETSSCTSCHREHVTSAKMPPPPDSSCASCHNREDLMAASAIAGHAIPAHAFPTGVPRRPGGLLLFYKPRPRDGYTATFAAFDDGHPEFQIHTAHLKDPDTLQYNHQRHLQADIPNTEKGERLDCKYCHKPDNSGSNFQKITFETNCVHCHALAFDPNMTPGTDPNDPGLVIPHGDPGRVSSFLRNLPNQYIEYAIRRNGSSSAEAQAFMSTSIAKLADSYGIPPGELTRLGPKLEQKVFYNAEHASGTATLRRRSSMGGNPDPTFFPGCAFCHRVSAPVVGIAPTITKAVIFDRWLGDGNFDHSKHQQQGCAECHSSITTSRLTSDINIPTQKSCTQCHNSKPGGVANDCMSCHHYHNDFRTETMRQTMNAR